MDVSASNNKKRKFMEINELCDDFHNKLSFKINEKIQIKKIKKYHYDTKMKINEIKTVKCSVHSSESICFMYGCSGIDSRQYKNYIMENKRENFDFYS